MSEQRILELERQLLTATESVATLTTANTELTRQLADSDLRFRKLKRSARSDESSFQSQLAVAQSRRG